MILPSAVLDCIQENMPRLIKDAMTPKAYLCNGKRCANCSSDKGLCFHTTDKHYAMNKPPRKYERRGKYMFEV